MLSNDKTIARLLQTHEAQQAAASPTVELVAAAGDADPGQERKPLGDLLPSKDTDLVADLEMLEERERTRLAVDQLPGTDGLTLCRWIRSRGTLTTPGPSCAPGSCPKLSPTRWSRVSAARP